MLLHNWNNIVQSEQQRKKYVLNTEARTVTQSRKLVDWLSRCSVMHANSGGMHNVLKFIMRDSK